MHQQATVHPAYVKAFRAEPAPFCQGCHAPESAADKPVAAELKPLGVGCVTCHLTGDDAVLAAPSTQASAAPHAIRRTEEFAGDGACRGCHEFAFPGALDDTDGSYMQTTIREHQRSAGASRPCSGCHMPLREGHKSHDFAQTRSPTWLRDNLEVKATRDDDGVQIQLRQTAPGHGFPTGDLFRRLEVGVRHLAADGRVLGEQQHYLARRFETEGMKIGRRLTRDDRVFDEPRQVVFSLPPGGKALWWVTYQRVSFVGDGSDPLKSKIESQTMLHRGELR